MTTKFNIGDKVVSKTTGLAKTVLAVNEDHYLTDVGVVRSENESDYIKRGD